MHWYWKVLKHYADFSGRARRKEYWMFFLFNAIFSYLSRIIDSVAGTVLSEGYGTFSLIYGFGMFIPGLAVTVRRLHDIGKSGWMILIPWTGVIVLYMTKMGNLTYGFVMGGFVLIWFGFSIWFLILLVTDSNSGENQYGLNPKAITP